MQKICEFSARISCEKPSRRNERIGSVIDRSRHADSIRGLRARPLALSMMIVVAPRRTIGAEPFFEFFVVGIVGGGFHWAGHRGEWR